MATKRTAKTRKTTKAKRTAKTRTTKKTTKTKKTNIKCVKKARTKTEIMNALSEITDLPRKDINSVFEALGNVMKQDLGNKGPGIFTVPGLMKVRVVKKPATKARKGTNPFTGEPMTFKAKPARNIVRIRPLTGLKSMV